MGVFFVCFFFILQAHSSDIITKIPNAASTSLLFNKSVSVVQAAATRVRPVWLLSPAESRCEAM